MNDEICVVSVSRDNYDFNTADGKHLSGTAHKVCIAYYHGGAEIPYRLEILKTSAEEFEKARTAIGKRCRGYVLYDKYGRFAGVGG